MRLVTVVVFQIYYQNLMHLADTLFLSNSQSPVIPPTIPFTETMVFMAKAVI